MLNWWRLESVTVSYPGNDTNDCSTRRHQSTAHQQTVKIQLTTTQNKYHSIDWLDQPSWLHCLHYLTGMILNLAPSLNESLILNDIDKSIYFNAILQSAPHLVCLGLYIHAK